MDKLPVDEEKRQNLVAVTQVPYYVLKKELKRATPGVQNINYKQNKDDKETQQIMGVDLRYIYKEIEFKRIDRLVRRTEDLQGRMHQAMKMYEKRWLPSF